VGSIDQVQSVLGPVAITDLGITMPHEHTFVDTMREYRGDGLVDDAPMILADLRRFAELGGRTIVDCTTRGLRPRPERLPALSRETGVTIVTGTGFYRHPFLDEAWFDGHTVNEVADLLIDDIRTGINGTGVRAGIIGEIGCDRYLTPAEERSFRAAARAHLETQLTITTHAARWPVGLPQLDLLAEEGVAAARVIVGHCDLVDDPAYHLALATRGAWVQFDNIQAGPDHLLDRTVRAVRALVDAGYARRILLSQDICLVSQFQTMGGSGYGYILRSFVERLSEAGLEAATIDGFLIDNPARALSGQP
jgi:predicted metal-dependent phosphotriesterase family hydrolase